MLPVRASVQGTLTYGSCPGVAAAMPASSPCRASCSRRHGATCAIASGLVVSKSGKRSIEDSISLFPVSWNLVIHFCKSIVPLLYFMHCMNRYKNTAWAPPWWNGVARIFWNIYFTPSFGSFNNSLFSSLLYWDVSPSNLCLNAGPHFSGSNSVRSHQSWIGCQKQRNWSFHHKQGLPSWSSAESCECVNGGLLGRSSPSMRVILVPSICIDNVELIIIAMACHIGLYVELTFNEGSQLRYSS